MGSWPGTLDGRDHSSLESLPFLRSFMPYLEMSSLPWTNISGFRGILKTPFFKWLPLTSSSEGV